MADQKTRLDSWKAIAQYLGRDERTVQRWELDRGLPVHRLPGAKRGGIFAYAAELDVWMTRRPVLEADGREELEGSAGNDAGAAEAGIRFLRTSVDLRRRPRIQSCAPRAFLHRPAFLVRKGAAAAFLGCNCGVGRTPGCVCPILNGKSRRLFASRHALGGQVKPASFDRPPA